MKLYFFLTRLNRKKMGKTKYYFFTFFFSFCLAIFSASVPAESEAIKDLSDEIKITILYDNYVFKEGTRADWGFSCLIEGTEETILFDTGTQADILRHNIETLGVDITQVDIIVISHNHGDHTGGLLFILDKVSPSVPVYAPTSYLGKDIEAKQDRIIRKTEPVEICRNVFLTGEMGTSIKEQALILNMNRGLVIITGCAHPGIVGIIEKAKTILNKNVYFVLGGFHLASTPENEVLRIIERFKELGVVQCGATHCTGEEAINLFKKAFGENYIAMGTGRTIELE